MSTLVKQIPGDLDPCDRETPVADPNTWLVDVDGATAFEYGGAL